MLRKIVIVLVGGFLATLALVSFIGGYSMHGEPQVDVVYYETPLEYQNPLLPGPQISKYESVTTPGDCYRGTIYCLIGLCVLALYAHVTSKRDKQNRKQISRDEFEKGKKKVPPEERIVDFLEKNKNKAFTSVSTT